MKNALLYLITVLAWGSSWLAIEFQIGEVDLFASICYRFSLAALIMWCFCLLTGINLRFSLRQHGFIGLLALFNFSANYVFIYLSQLHLTSAMTSIAFSTMVLMNIVNTRIFFGTPIRLQVWLGAFCGLSGLVALFWRDIKLDHLLLGSNDTGASILLGLGFAVTAAFIVSLGNMVSIRNSSNSMSVVAVNAWAMLYGALLLALVVVTSGAEFGFSTKPSYLVSLVYLSCVGTVLAFTTYYVLLNRIGAQRASYVVVLFPIVSVTLSTLFEGFTWGLSTVVGFVLVLIGNALVLASKP